MEFSTINSCVINAGGITRLESVEKGKSGKEKPPGPGSGGAAAARWMRC
jgi:hypothetical protein